MDTRCILCDRTLTEAGLSDESNTTICLTCLALPLAERRKLRDEAMTRLMREATERA